MLQVVKGSVELYAFDGASATCKRLSTAPSAIAKLPKFKLQLPNKSTKLDPNHSKRHFFTIFCTKHVLDNRRYNLMYGSSIHRRYCPYIGGWLPRYAPMGPNVGVFQVAEAPTYG